MGAILSFEILPDRRIVGLCLNARYKKGKNWLSDLQLVMAQALPGAVVTESADNQWDAFLRIDRVSAEVPTSTQAFNALLAEAARQVFASFVPA